MANIFPSSNRLATAVRILTPEFCTTHSAHNFSRRLQDVRLSATDTAVIAAFPGTYFLDHQDLKLLIQSLGDTSVADGQVPAVVGGISKALRELSSLAEAD